MKILKNLKNTFYPTIHNSWQPYLVRLPALVSVTAGLLIIQVVVSSPMLEGRVKGLSTEISSTELFELTNRERQSHEVGHLREDVKLAAAAEAKARDMFEKNYWAHYAPDGTGPWHFVESSGYFYKHAGENLAQSFKTSEGVIAGWLQSPEHRDNMLNHRYKDIGIAVMQGEIGGQSTTVVVALYATPMPLSVRVGEAAASSAGGEVLPATTSNYSLVNPILSVAVLPLTSQLAVLAATGLSMVYALQHIVVKNRRVLWDQHIHPRPLVQAAVLVGVALLVVGGGMGAVG